MHIFIDESGQFIPLDSARSRAAAVAAVMIPSSRRTAFGRAFRRAKRSIGSGGSEVKGSSLSEGDAALLLQTLERFDVIVEAVVIDIGNHSAEAVTAFKNAQASRLLAHITREHQPSLIRQLLEYEERLKRLPNQLFLQAFCLWDLIPRLVETATMFYSQRLPRELGGFVWRVDAKGAGVTELEHIWTTLIGPIIATRSESAPMGLIPGGDYTFFDRFNVPAPPEITKQNRFLTDMKLVLQEDFRFVPSHKDLGVQAADVVVASLTRALNGSMGQPGWQHLGPLFVARKPQSLRFIALETASGAVQSTRSSDQWAQVSSIIDSSARQMLTTHTARLMRERGA